MYEQIRYEVDDPVAVVTLNRPQALNAWTETMDVEVRDALTRAAADPKVVGIVVTGEGRAFCAGADMNLLSDISGGGSEHALAANPARAARGRADNSDDDFAGRFPYVMAIDKPVIAAINGAVAGMAFPFALCCDIRVVSPNALFVSAFVRAWPDRRVGSVVVAAAAGRAGGGARPALHVRGGSTARRPTGWGSPTIW